MRLFNIMDTAFESFDTTVTKYLSKTLNSLGLQNTHTQIFSLIFDGIKGIMQNVMFYIEDAFTEQNIFTATRKKSVYNLAKISGYEPFYGSAASGVLLGTMNVNTGLDSTSSKVYLQNGSRIISRSTGLSYALYLPSNYYVFDVTKPLLKHEFSIIQGYFITNTYTSSGYEFETVSISVSDLWDREYITVMVDGTLYEESANMYEMVEDGEQYVLTAGYDGGFDIMFGNGVYGKKLNEGQTIVIKYLKHSGAKGNLATNGSHQFLFADQATDSLGNLVNPNEYMTLTLSSSLSGGANSDNIKFIRNMVGMNSRSLVLASEDNFELFLKRFSFIGYANCWSEPNSMTITASCMQDMWQYISQTLDYYSLDTSSLLLTTEQKTMITDTLDNSNKAFAGVTLKFEDPVIRKYAIICYVKADNIYNRETICTAIKNSIAIYFLSLGSDIQFIAKSAIINAIINGTPNISAVDIDIISELAEKTYYKGYYYQYELKMVNETYEYVTKKVMYEPETSPGLDNYGNISVDSKLEVPFLSSGFRYYADKDNYDKTKNVFSIVEPVQIQFI